MIIICRQALWLQPALIITRKTQKVQQVMRSDNNEFVKLCTEFGNFGLAGLFSGESIFGTLSTAKTFQCFISNKMSVSQLCYIEKLIIL